MYKRFIDQTNSAIVEPLRERDNLSTKDTFHISNSVLLYGVYTFSTSKKRTASLQGLVPMCPFLGGSLYMYYTVMPSNVQEA